MPTEAFTPETPQAVLDDVIARRPALEEGIVLDARGHRLAGSPALAGAARDLLDGTDSPGVHVRTPRGQVFAARDGEHAVVVVAGQSASAPLTLYDLRDALARVRVAR